MPDDGKVELIVSWFGHLERMENIGCPKNLRPRIGKEETKGKRQEWKERGSRDSSSITGSEKMDGVGDR